MEAIVESLIQHGYWILFAWVLLDQLALPVPALPMLLAAGALAGEGHLNILLCLLLVVFACTPPNLLWYQLGLRQGNKVLTLLCMISLEPDSCIANTTSVFHRYGTASLLFSKFVPGLQTIAPPLAGLLGISFWRFVAVHGVVRPPVRFQFFHRAGQRLQRRAVSPPHTHAVTSFGKIGGCRVAAVTAA